MIKNFIKKTLLGILLLPLAAGAAASLYHDLRLLSVNSLSSMQLIFFFGIIAYCLIHLFLLKPNYLYVFGHELIHVMATWICFGRVKSFKVSSKGGSVKTTKSNFFITLSPYFIPAYVVIFSIIYFILSLFLNPPGLSVYFVFLLGVSFAFHLVMTADVLKKKQPDILKTGYFLSIVLIFLFNVIVVALFFSWMFEEINIITFFKETLLVAGEIYVRIFNQLFSPL